MRRKAYAPGTAALLTVVLAGCTGGGAQDSGAADAKPGSAGTTATAARPGKYGTLPEPCGVVDRGTLDSLLPGLKELDDQAERDKAYRGTLTPTFDNERRVGCGWKAEGEDGSGSLRLDFERVVSYDAGVSDDQRATEVYERLETAAHLPPPEPIGGAGDGAEDSSSPSGSPSAPASPSGSPDSSRTKSARGPEGSPSPSSSPTSTSTPTSISPPSPSSSSSSSSSSSGADGGASGDTSGDSGSPSTGLPSRTLSGLGDSAYVDDQLGTTGSSGSRRTVTVVFRTSNVVVTVRYQQQPARAGELPDSKETQDKARKVAERVAGSFDS